MTGIFARTQFHEYLIKVLLKQNPCNIRRSQGRGRTRDLKCVLKGYLSVFYLYSTWRTRFWAFFRHFQLQVQVPGSGGQISKVILIFQNLYHIVQFDELSLTVQYFSDLTFLSQVTAKNSAKVPKGMGRRGKMNSFVLVDTNGVFKSLLKQSLIS